MEEKRKNERREKTDRRTGEMDIVYKRLVEKGIIADSRKGERRKEKEKPNFSNPPNEEQYLLYTIGMERTNSERRKNGLAPLPIISLKEWIKSK